MKRLRIILIVLAVLLVGVVVFCILQPKEPSYQGKTLSQWLANYEVARDAGLSQEENARLDELQHATDDAVRHMGTDALPFLAKMLTEKESKFMGKLRDLARRQSLIDFHIKSPFEVEGVRMGRQQRAVIAFGVLGRKAKDAIPIVLRALDEDDPYSIMYAAEAIGATGPDAVEPLTKALTNTNWRVRCTIASVLADWSFADDENREGLTQAERSTASIRAVPTLLKLLKDPNLRVHYIAMRSLGEIHQQPEIVIPEILSYLNSTTETDRHVAVQALARFGSQAKPAVPAIIKALENPQLRVREAATNALLKIDPEVAAKAGVQ